MKMYATEFGLIRASKKTKANADLIERLMNLERNKKDAEFIADKFPQDLLQQFSFMLQVACTEYRLLENQLLKTQNKLNAIQSKAKDRSRRDKSNS